MNLILIIECSFNLHCVTTMYNYFSTYFRYHKHNLDFNIHHLSINFKFSSHYNLIFNIPIQWWMDKEIGVREKDHKIEIDESRCVLL